MQRHWELDEDVPRLVDHFTLLPPEVQLIREARTAHNRLGFAVLLKCFLLEGRFPMPATWSVFSGVMILRGINPRSLYLLFRHYDTGATHSRL
jgi:Domain of unknown function (DUF4158)